MKELSAVWTCACVCWCTYLVHWHHPRGQSPPAACAENGRWRSGRFAAVCSTPRCEIQSLRWCEGDYQGITCSYTYKEKTIQNGISFSAFIVMQQKDPYYRNNYSVNAKGFCAKKIKHILCFKNGTSSGVWMALWDKEEHACNRIKCRLWAQTKLIWRRQECEKHSSKDITIQPLSDCQSLLLREPQLKWVYTRQPFTNSCD